MCLFVFVVYSRQAGEAFDLTPSMSHLLCVDMREVVRNMEKFSE